MPGRFCPRCGEPFDHDGDRIYDDHCHWCGWATPKRKRADEYHSKLFAAVRAGDNEEADRLRYEFALDEQRIRGDM